MTVLTLGKARRLVAAFFTAAGTPARVDGPPSWAIDNPDVADLVVLDALTVRVIAKAPGTCNVTATADADLGEGVRPLMLSAAFTVPEPEAVNATITVGDEETVEAPAPEPVVEAPVAEVVVEAPVVEAPAPAPEPVVEAPAIVADAPSSEDPIA